MGQGFNAVVLTDRGVYVGELEGHAIHADAMAELGVYSDETCHGVNANIR